MTHPDVTKLARAREIAASGVGREVRERARLTVGDLGRACGVDQSTVYRWEQGTRLPRGEAAVRYLEVIEALAKQLPPAEIVGAVS